MKNETAAAHHRRPRAGLRSIGAAPFGSMNATNVSSQPQQCTPFRATLTGTSHGSEQTHTTDRLLGAE
jgi:hypothetical protein